MTEHCKACDRKISLEVVPETPEPLLLSPLPETHQLLVAYKEDLERRFGKELADSCSWWGILTEGNRQYVVDTAVRFFLDEMEKSYKELADEHKGGQLAKVIHI